jgi:hypothetical protein
MLCCDLLAIGITSDSIYSDTDLPSHTELAGTNSGSTNVDDAVEKGLDDCDARGAGDEGSNGKCCYLVLLGISSDSISSDTDVPSCIVPVGANSGSTNVDDTTPKRLDEGDASSGRTNFDDANAKGLDHEGYSCGAVGESSTGKCCALICCQWVLLQI